MSKEKSCGKIDEKDLENVAGGSSTNTFGNVHGNVTNQSNDNTNNNSNDWGVLNGNTTHVGVGDVGDGDGEGDQ